MLILENRYLVNRHADVGRNGLNLQFQLSMSALTNRMFKFGKSRRTT